MGEGGEDWCRFWFWWGFFPNFMPFNIIAQITAELGTSDLAVATQGCHQRLLLVLMWINYPYFLQDLEISVSACLETVSLSPCSWSLNSLWNKVMGVISWFKVALHDTTAWLKFLVFAAKKVRILLWLMFNFQKSSTITFSFYFCFYKIDAVDALKGHSAFYGVFICLSY